MMPHVNGRGYVEGGVCIVREFTRIEDPAGFHAKRFTDSGRGLSLVPNSSGPNGPRPDESDDGEHSCTEHEFRLRHLTSAVAPTPVGIPVLTETLCEAARSPVPAEEISRIRTTGGTLPAATSSAA